MADHATLTPQGRAAGNSELDPVRKVALERLAREMDRLVRAVTHDIPAPVLTAAVAAPTDLGMVARILGDPRLLGTAGNLDPFAPAIARSHEHRYALAGQAGGLLTAEEAATLLKLTRQAIDKRRTNRTILAVRDGGRWLYPRCQFHDGGIVPGIGEIVQAFARQGAWIALDFLLAPDDVLRGRSPLEALLEGERSSVLELLRGEESDSYG